MKCYLRMEAAQISDHEGKGSTEERSDGNLFKGRYWYSYIYKCIFKYYLYNCLKLTGDVLSQKMTDS